ncbi:MAG: EAL domain-containing protein [Pseudomonadota bacterium]|nr:EAL domain-containing protein [Pseudomonadota bacterium]
MGAHTVQFYEDDTFLIKGLSDYVGNALGAGDRAIAIATGDHLARLEKSLAARGLLDAAGNATSGRYIRLDADLALPLFMDDGHPDEARFRDTIGNVILDATEDHHGELFVFGEMVALLRGLPHCTLCSPIEHDAAVHVERYLNSLLSHFAFTLLCAYPLSAFPSADDTGTFHEICALHTEVLPAESYDPATQRETLQRTVAGLQQQAHALSREVHDRKIVEQALREVNVDRLTGLPNRNVFQDRLELDIKRSQRSGRPLALLFIDLDHFKEINDTRGHGAGDLLLQAVGHRLQGHVRESDTVARLGGDEFTITLAELHDTVSVTDIAQKLCDDLARPFMVDDEPAYISASIGITIYPRDGATAGDLLRNADQAMYRSKERGRNRFTYFKRAMQDAAQSRMTLSNELRRAVEDHQLEVYYQPIVDLATGKLRKAEALLRWRHPERGDISPVEFIPIAEHTGLISTIGDWVYQQALAKARDWRKRDPQLTVNVNVSPLQFYEGDGEHCRKWLGDGAPGETAAVPEIGIEITEGLLIASDTEVLKQLLAFQQAGIKISLDDFGTGYSSLSYLRKFALDFLKIDKSFVYNLEYDAANVALCEAIIVMAHKLGLKVIAEGVETRPQADLLQHAGCDYAQGFLFGHAVPAAEFETLLRA